MAKTELKIGPIFHWNERRVRAHLGFHDLVLVASLTLSHETSRRKAFSGRITTVFIESAILYFQSPQQSSAIGSTDAAQQDRQSNVSADGHPAQQAADECG